MGKKLTKAKLRKEVLAVFKKNPNKSFNYKQIAKLVNANTRSRRRLIIEILEELANQKKIIEIRPGKYQLHPITKHVIGILDMSNKEFPIVRDLKTNEEIYIPLHKLDHALHNDKVEVVIYAKSKRKNMLQGEIIRVVERTKQLFVGTVIKSEHFAFLTTNYKSMPYDIFIPLKKLNGAKDGDRALARIIEWPSYAKNPIGEIVEILGRAGDHEAEMHAILAEFDLPLKFPENVLKEAEKIPSIIPEDEIKKRKDFRNVITFTIDPADAKDFDDAISFRKIRDGLYEIGIHIADVTYYVKPGTALDKEAEKRGTSVYLVDRVVPMLPEKLSNDLCSLNPHTDKLTFSVVVKMDDNAKVLSTWIGRTIINSNRRFNYDEVQQIIKTKKGDFAEQILKLHDLAQKLRKRRFKNGAIAFESTEMKFKLDPLGKPVDVYFKKMQESNQLVEEFMLLANRKVAERIGKVPKDKKPKTFVYRVHDKPNIEKLRNFALFVEQFGFKISLKSPKTFAFSLNKLFELVKDNPVALIIAQLGIRTMAKAIYSTNNIGHYGLAFKYYTHFTSPIRRYPDMMVHRLLERYLIEKKPSADKKFYEKRCKHATEMEQLAQQAEWASIKYKAIEYMQDKIGQEFKGIIAGINEWGMFVQLLDNNIEGTVMIRDIEDDFYIYDEDNFCLIGEYTGKKYQIGDIVLVRVARIDLIKRQLDFELIKKLASPKLNLAQQNSEK